jgi:hypothetical protein
LELSNAFAQGATDDAAKQAAARAVFFYFGRLEHADPQAVKSAMQNLKIDPKTAPEGMTACAARLDRAVQAIQALGKPPTPGK